MKSISRARDVYERRKQDLKEATAGIKKPEAPRLLSRAAQEWQERKQLKWAPKTQEIASNALKHLLKELGSQLLADIDALDVARYQKLRIREGASNRTVNIEVATLRQIMKRHGQWERLRNSDAWADVGMLKERDDAGRKLTTEEESMLILECGRSPSRGLLPFVVLLMETGARFNTIRTLQWGQIDLTRRHLKIGHDKTDAGSGREVPLSSRAVATLELWAEEFPNRKSSHFVFPSEKYGLHGSKGIYGGDVKVYATKPTKPFVSIKHAWQTVKRNTRHHCPQCRTGVLVNLVCNSCNLVVDELPQGLTIRFHDLRHTAVSRMVSARVPLTTIAKIVGWSKSTTVEMAARYAHPEMDEMRDAVEKISGISSQSPQFSPQSETLEKEIIN